MSGKKFTDQMANRSPLGKREAVVPAKMYGEPQAHKPTRRQGDKRTGHSPR